MFNLERFKREKISLHARNPVEFDAIVRFLRTTDINITIPLGGYNLDHTDFVANWRDGKKDMSMNRVKYGPAAHHQCNGWTVITVDELRNTPLISMTALNDLFDE